MPRWGGAKVCEGVAFSHKVLSRLSAVHIFVKEAALAWAWGTSIVRGKALGIKLEYWGLDQVILCGRRAYFVWRQEVLRRSKSTMSRGGAVRKCVKVQHFRTNCCPASAPCRFSSKRLLSLGRGADL